MIVEKNSIVKLILYNMMQTWLKYLNYSIFTICLYINYITLKDKV